PGMPRKYHGLPVLYHRSCRDVHLGSEKKLSQVDRLWGNSSVNHSRWFSLSLVRERVAWLLHMRNFLEDSSLDSRFTGFCFLGLVRIQLTSFLLGFAALACGRTLNTVWPGSC